jgi:hypothetical protein
LSSPSIANSDTTNNLTIILVRNFQTKLQLVQGLSPFENLALFGARLSDSKGDPGGFGEQLKRMRLEFPYFFSLFFSLIFQVICISNPPLIPPLIFNFFTFNKCAIKGGLGSMSLFFQSIGLQLTGLLLDNSSNLIS